MKRILSLLLVFALMLSMVTSAFAAEGTEGGEEPQESEAQTTVTVGTLEELQAAVAAAEDGDTIAISAEITLDGVALETDEDITIVRADTYQSGAFMRLKHGAKLSGFNFEDNSASTIILDSSWETAVEIKDCHFKGDSENTRSFIFAGGGINFFNQFLIDNCTFDGASYSAVTSRSNLTLTVSNSVFTNNSTDTQGGAIHSSSTLILDNCTFTDNYAVSGGGVYCSGDLTITDCQFSGNQIESEKFGTDILSSGTLSITDDPQDGAGYYEESTGEKVSLPLADYTSTAKLIYLTDADAAVYFAPEEPEEPEEQEPSPDDTEDDEQDGGEDNSNPDEPDEGKPENPTETPPEQPEQPDSGEGDDTPPDTEEPPTTPDLPLDEPDNDDDDEPTVIYRPVYIYVPVEPEPEEPETVEPSLICGDAIIDVYRSVVLEGYNDGLLHLEDGLTRAQFMTILYRLLNEETIERYNSTDTVFADVEPDAWYCRYVTTIANAGIVCGTGDGNFDPDGLLTWGHIVMILSRFVEQQNYDLQNINYNGWAVDALETAVALGWITDHAAFNPDAPISRGELAYFMNFVLGLYR